MRELIDLFAVASTETYGEEVSMADHMLLTAKTAREAGASNQLIVACLLHDIGHLLADPDDGFGRHDHDEIGARWVARHFPESVSEPVRLHVAAKRYLCATEPSYRTQLSPASQHTLAKQGGPMSPDEVSRFEASPYSGDAVRLRRWEDSFAKRPGGEVPDLTEFLPIVDELRRP